MTTQPDGPSSDAVVRALQKVRSRANKSGTSTQHGTVFAEGLLCAANMFEASLITDQSAREIAAQPGEGDGFPPPKKGYSLRARMELERHFIERALFDPEFEMCGSDWDYETELLTRVLELRDKKLFPTYPPHVADALDGELIAEIADNFLGYYDMLPTRAGDIETSRKRMRMAIEEAIAARAEAGGNDHG